MNTLGCYLFGKTWLLREALEFVEFEWESKLTFLRSQPQTQKTEKGELNDTGFELLFSSLQFNLFPIMMEVENGCI